ncbi:MAG TPA: hypothetical protein VF143_08575 [Candidatus Nanopelagicales bacterium]
MTALRILLEVGTRRTFASAVDWPGWARSARTPEQAIATLLDSAHRYAAVVDVATGLPAPREEAESWAGSRPEDWQPAVVAERPGTPGTEFGVPEAILDEEQVPPDPPAAERIAALVSGAWAVLDAIAAASPAELRKGPRGGGRDRDPMVAHVLGAEAGGYAKRLGLTLQEPGIGDVAAIAAERAAILEVLRSGEPLPNPRRKLWPVRYAGRRIAWHVLDHAWEMEDRRA